MNIKNYGGMWCIDQCYLLSKADLPTEIEKLKSPNLK